MSYTKPLIIGIAGGSGSGKSTFAKMLAEKLQPKKITVISTDRFFKKSLPQMISPRSGQIYDDWNSPDSINFDRLMEEINACRSSEVGYDLIIVEGLSVLYFPKLLEILQLKIFVDLDSDERMYRRIRRNMKMWGVSMEEVADYYLDAAKYEEEKYFLSTKRQADLILNGSSDFSRPLSVIVSWITENLE